MSHFCTPTQNVLDSECTNTKNYSRSESGLAQRLLLWSLSSWSTLPCTRLFTETQRVNHELGDSCPSSKAQTLQCCGARLEVGSGPFTWWNCKKLEQSFCFWHKKKSCLAEGMPERTDGSGQMCQDGRRATRRIWDQTVNSPSQKQKTDPAILKDLETAQV